MASGKSSVGKVLSKKRSIDFIDLDSEIGKRLGMTVPEIFATKGEIFFRKQEQTVLNELLSTDRPFVLSLGGGTPCYGNAMEKIKSADKSVSVFLKAAIGTLAERIFHEKESRPLVSHLVTEDALREFIGIHLFERSGVYNSADYVISVDNKTPEEVADEINAILI